MEGFPPGSWDLARTNFVTWANDLTRAPASKGVNAARDRIFDLGRRLDTILRVIMYDEEVSEDEDEELMGAGEGDQKGKDEDVVMEQLLENDPPVRVLCHIHLHSLR